MKKRGYKFRKKNVRTRFMGEFGGRRGKEEMMQLNCNCIKLKQIVKKKEFQNNQSRESSQR